MIRRISTVLSILTVLLIAAGCGTKPAASPTPSGVPSPGQSNAPSKPATLTQVVVVAGVPNLTSTFAPFLSVPKFLGFFEQEGLDVQIQGTNGAPAALQQMLSGKAQFTTHSTAALFSLREKGAKVKAVFDNIPTNFQYPVVLQDSPIKSIKDAKGKTIGVNAMNSGPHIVVQAMLRTAGIDPASVKFVEVGTGAPAWLALKDGKVDIIGLWEAQYMSFESQGAQLRPLLDSPAQEIGFQHGTFTTDDYINSNPAVVAGVGRATAKGMLWAYYNPEAAVRIHWKLFPSSKPTGISEEAAMKAAKDELIAWMNRSRPKERFESNTEPIGSFRKGEVELLRDVLKQAGLIQNAADASTYVDDSLVAKMNEFDRAAVISQAKAYKFPQ